MTATPAVYHAHRGEITIDEQTDQIKIRAKLPEQLQHGRLNQDIRAGGLLVQDHDLPTQGQNARQPCGTEGLK